MQRTLLRGWLLCGVVVLAGAQRSFAWGVEGHHIINQVACAGLPADVPAFLRSPQAMDAMVYYAPLPDHWRGTLEPELATATAPEHFIQLESVDAVLPVLPRGRYDYVRALAVAQASHPDMIVTAEKFGMQPYQTDEVWERLKVAMRDYRELLTHKEDTRPVEQEIVFLAGWLGHYVGDGSMPLHTSDKPNGWIGPNPNGYTTDHKIHGLFESEFVRNNVKAADGISSGRYATSADRRRVRSVHDLPSSISRSGRDHLSTGEGGSVQRTGNARWEASRSPAAGSGGD